MRHLLSALHQLPDLVIVALVVALSTLIAAASPFIRHHVGRIAENKDRETAAFDGYKVIMGMIGVVLAFSLVQSNSNLQAVEAIVGKEASALAAVDRALLRSGRPELVALRPDLTSFGTMLVKEEWPALATGDRSAAADEAFARLSRGARAFVPGDMRQQTLFAELLKTLDDLAEYREQVIESSSIALPGLFWATAAGLLVIALLLAAYTGAHHYQTLGVAASAAAIGFLLACVIVIDRPFEGQTSVSPKPILKALERNSHRVAAFAPPGANVSN